MSDFTRRLPRDADVRTFLAEVGSSSSRAGATFGGAQVQEREGSPERLARVDITLSLRGTYPQLKAVLVDLLGRFPAVTVTQWRMRRLDVGGASESSMVFALWSSGTLAANGQRRVGEVQR